MDIELPQAVPCGRSKKVRVCHQEGLRENPEISAVQGLVKNPDVGCVCGQLSGASVSERMLDFSENRIQERPRAPVALLIRG